MVEDRLVGRTEELRAIEAALRAPAGAVVAIEGEPGIGKSRLLGHLAERAASEEATVLGARASEFERDLPYALWTEALDGHLAGLGERRLARLGLADPAALTPLLPALGGESTAGDRHRVHRALRDLLERLAAARPLVLWMDDVHWADPASVDALAALVRRAPTGRVVLALAAREGQLPTGLELALAGEDRAVTIRPRPLSEAEATELVGEAAATIYADAGGNPFYLEQLARVRRSLAGPAPTSATPADARAEPRLPAVGPEAATAPPAGVVGAAGVAGLSETVMTTPAGGGARRFPGATPEGAVPPAVAAALAAELAALEPDARRLVDGAAVAGDPFELDLAAAAAELPGSSALGALDELLVRGLARPTEVPRRFAFRHPVVRHAVYEAAPPGWRLGAHARAAEALERRGAGPVERAHHVEHAAAAGDEGAIALLIAAAEELQSPAPKTAARFYEAALRLLPDHPDRRRPLQRSLADAQAAAGDPAAARETLLDALRTAEPDDRLALTVALANQEWWLGGHDDARRRLHVALGELPAEASPDRIRLRLALALTALLACDLDDAKAHASDARADAMAIGDPVFELAALAGGALASAAAADGPDALRRVDESAAALERLTANQLATRLPAFWMHGRARRLLGQPEAALADLRRGAALAEQTGRERLLLMITVESVATLVDLGRLAEALAASEEGVERARLAGNPRMLLWAHGALASALLAAGDVAGALRAGEQAAALDTRPDFHAAGQPGWCLGAALTAAGNADRAVPLMLEAFGGPHMPAVLPAERPAAAADLVEAQLAIGDIEAAEAGSRAAGADGDAAPARAADALARAAILVARDQPRAAVEAAVVARELAAAVPFTAARALLAEGQAHAAAGDRESALRTLTAAEAAFDGFGALRRRDEAARELRRLGHRVLRPSRAPDTGPLTAREREIAELVAAGRTNREAAEQLVLSTRTVEAHLRNIYAKLDVRSRVELTRALQVRPDADQAVP